MKTNDVTLTVIIIIMFFLLYIFNFIVAGIQRIKDNWPIYRCQPLVMPFASIFGHNTKENFGFCIQNMQKGFMEPLLRPLNFNVGLLSDITSGLTTNLNSSRDFFKEFRISSFGAFQNIFSAIFNITVEIQRVLINIKDTIGKLIGIMTTVLYTLDGSIMTMQSAWDGPPGDLVRILCFHPETKLQLISGEFVSMKDIPLNSILQNDTRVCAVMNISNLDENGLHVEKMYKVKRKNSSSITENTEPIETDDILVSGSHLIYDPNTKQFVHVKDLPASELTEINCDTLSCLITSNHTIPIGEWIFHDWEDSNGSAPKKIG
jgi:hypothetical protein